jgi:hypothetical protein
MFAGDKIFQDFFNTEGIKDIDRKNTEGQTARLFR